MISPILSVDDVLRLSDPVLADLGVNDDAAAPYDAYLRGHAPGSVFVDLDRWLSAPSSDAAGRHPLPDPAIFAEGMRRAGISQSDVVIGVDRVGGVYAARLVWMLRVIGVEAALLDGGLASWPGELEQGEVWRAESGFLPRAIPPERLAELPEITRLADDCADGADPAAVLLDARDAHRYRGEPDPLGAVTGHIPGARSLPCREHLSPHGVLLPSEVLRARFAAVGVDSTWTPVISSCGSGITACHNLLVMEHIGLGSGRLYAGSWSQWSVADRPIAVGSTPCGSGGAGDSIAAS